MFKTYLILKKNKNKKLFDLWSFGQFSKQDHHYRRVKEKDLKIE